MYTHSDKRSPQFRLATAEKQANEYWYNFYRYPETYPYGYIDGNVKKHSYRIGTSPHESQNK